eukprot:TRINITY_DN12160_c0_g1_i1.p1 TRINITY_DN12160_c0_g1~~TRINITY_DN12160_c0_g1_i1.p1  ORF type:complete len:116 (+),score=17.42 TRINITY_DN12160_c0_g1_i1:65-412(+)
MCIRDRDYFKHLETRPGAYFFRRLLESTYPIQSVSLRIPKMLVNIGVTVMLKTGCLIGYCLDKHGRLKAKEKVKASDFIKKLEKNNDKMYKDQPLMCIQNINYDKPWQEHEVTAP